MSYIPYWGIEYKDEGFLDLDNGQISFNNDRYGRSAFILRTKRDCNKMIQFLCNQHNFFESDLIAKKIR